MLPVALGRDESLSAWRVTSLFCRYDGRISGRGRAYDRGGKANSFLPPAYRRLAEEAGRRATLEELARFQLRLARLMQEHGPAICEQWQVDYPQALEDAALGYVARELRQLGFGATLEELHRLL